MYYSEEIIDQVSRANNIVDIVGEYVNLKKKGNRYMGLCPFHNEKTPSFSVSEEHQLYHCFGCGCGGNVYTFLMEYENITFQETVQKLAGKAHIELPSDSDEDKKNASMKQKMLEANRDAARFYFNQLKTTAGAAAYQYLLRRGLSLDTIIHFGLGYAPNRQDALYRFLKEKGYGDYILEKCGLIRIHDNGKVTDRFWNRVMFPILDVNNRVVGFGGRVMGDGKPKYLNSPESILFDKSRTLYGIQETKKTKNDYFLLCEGYMDVIALQQAGFKNAVAALGTSFTSQHAVLIKRYVKNVVLAFDSDQAGISAASRAIPILRRADLSIRVLDMRPYKDPDEFLKAEGYDAYENRIKNAQNFFFFEMDQMKLSYDFNDPDQMTRFHNELAKHLLEFHDEVERNNYIRIAAERYGIDAGSLQRKTNQLQSGLRPGESYTKFLTEQDEAVKENQKRKKMDNSEKQAQRMLISGLVKYPEVYFQISQLLHESDFFPEYQPIVHFLFQSIEKNVTLTPSELSNHFLLQEDSTEIDSKIISEIFHTNWGNINSQRELEKIFSDLVKKVKSSSLHQAGMSASNLNDFQKIVKEQDALRKLRIRINH